MLTSSTPSLDEVSQSYQNEETKDNTASGGGSEKLSAKEKVM